MHSHLTTALAEDRRARLLADARQRRLARSTRVRTVRPVRRSLRSWIRQDGAPTD